MKIEWKEVKIEGKKIKALLTIKEKSDRELLKNIYSDWKKLNDRLKAISTRGINLPETISENAFALFFPDCFRIVSLKGMKCSFDCLNIKTGSRIQIKASSIASDLTSFGPKSEWDELFFLDFSKGYGSFKVFINLLESVKFTLYKPFNTPLLELGDLIRVYTPLQVLTFLS